MTAFSKLTLPLFICLLTTLNAFSQGLERYHTLKDTSWVPKNLGYKKRIQITVPVEYQENLPQSFPLIIVFDMQNQRQYQYILHSIDFLTGAEQMPSAVIVGIEAGKGGNRFRETQLKISDTACFGEKNEAFIFNELIPLLRSKFKAGQFTLLAGHSRYGFFTTYLLAKHPQELNAVISMSPFIQQPRVDLISVLKQEISKNEPRHMLFYRYAMGNDFPEDYKKLTEALKAPDFKPKNFNADGWWFPQADHLTTPGLTITRALSEVFDYWHTAQHDYLIDTNKNVSIIDPTKQKMTAYYGTALSSSIATLNGRGYAFYEKSDYANAILAWRRLAEEYPNFSNAYLNIAKCQKALKQPTDQTISEFKTSVAQSSMFNAEQKKDLLKDAEDL